MSHPVEAHKRAEQLLVERLRAALWIVVVPLLLFTFRDFSTSEAHLGGLLLVKLVQLAVIFGAEFALRGRDAERRAVPVAVASGALLCFLTAAAAILRQDVVTTPLIFVVLLMSMATLLPWGVRPQIIAVLCAAVALTVNVYAVEGSLGLVLQPRGMAVLTAMLGSIYIARIVRRYHRAIYASSESQRAIEQRQSALIDAVPVVLYRTEIAGGVVGANWISDTVERFTGFPASRFAGADSHSFWLSRLHPEDRERVVAELGAATLTGVASSEYRWLCANDRYRWFANRAVVVRDGKGGPLEVVGSWLDITESMEVAERIRRSEEYHRALVENAADVVIVIDVEGVIRDVSASITRVLGHRAEDLIGTHGFDKVHPDDLAFAAAKWQRGVDGLSLGHPIECRLRHANGSWRVLEITDNNLVDHAAVGAIVLNMRDVTDRKQAETALRDSEERCRVAMEAAEAANRAKSEVLANMSHEIRTPMNAIIGMTDMVLEGELAEDQRELIAVVRRAGESLLNLINDILDISKIEAGRLELENVAFEPRPLLEELCRTFAVDARRRGLTLESHIGDDVPTILTGDPGRLRQVLVNLLGNALKFTNDGGIAIEIRRRSSGTGTVEIEIAVRDSGIGIPADKLETIFGAFEQADDSTTRRYGGTGLGLAICTKLVALMGGRIWVESTVGRGSTFRFTAVLRCTEATEAADSALPETTRLPAGSLRVLLVEDNPVNRKVAQSMLEKRGHSVVWATNGREALEQLEECNFDLILMDVQMPEMDGLAATAEIRRRERATGRHVPIVATTAHALAGDRERCLEAGMDSYVAKPVRMAELFAVIDQLRPSAAV